MAGVGGGSSTHGEVRRRHKARSDDTAMGSSAGEVKDLQTQPGLDSERGDGVMAGTGPAPGGEETMRKKKAGSKVLVGCFLGIFVSYFIYGLVQEKITKRKFGDEKFHYFFFLVGSQCVMNALFAKFIVSTIYRGVEISMEPYRHFTVLSFTYVGAMVASNTSLAYISYPTQVLGKSAKPIPVLILGVLLSHKSYHISKYLIVLLIVLGVALFLYHDDGGGSGNDDNGDQWRLFNFLGIGELLVFVSLTFDGLTGAIQERLRKCEVHALHMMYAVNVYSAVYCLIAAIVTGEGPQAVAFIQRHPIIIFSLLAFGLCSAIGQVFIFTTITNFGPLTCSIFTTTRKFFTILGSVIIFGNSLLPRQWTGVLLVFLGLGLDIYFGKFRSASKSSSNGAKEMESGTSGSNHVSKNKTVGV